MTAPRHASLSATPVAMPARHAAPIGQASLAAILLALGAMTVQSTNPLLIATLAAAVTLCGWLVAGRRQLIHKRARSVGLLTLLWWFLVPLLLPSSSAGPVLLSFPTAELGPGVTVGGPLTLGGFVEAATSGLRAYAVCVLFGVGWQAFSGSGWWRLARAALGRGAELVGPWCFVGDATVAAWHKRQAEAAQGWSKQAGLGATLAMARAAAEGASPSLDPTWRVVVRGLVLGLLGALPVALLAGALPGFVRDHWSPLDLTVMVLLGVLVVASSGRLSGGATWPLAGAAILTAVVWLGRAWLPGEAALMWSASDGWPEVPYVALVAVLALPVSLVLAEVGRDA